MQGISDITFTMVTNANTSNKTISAPATTTSTSKLDSYEPSRESVYDNTLYSNSSIANMDEDTLLKIYGSSNLQDNPYWWCHWANNKELTVSDRTYMDSLHKQGFTSSEVSQMILGVNESGQVWFPPENASVDTKKAWIESLKKMSKTEFDHIWDVISYQAAGGSNAPEYGSSKYWDSVREGISQISSYQDFFKDCLASFAKIYQRNINEKLYDTEDVKTSMTSTQNALAKLIDTFTTYKIS